METAITPIAIRRGVVKLLLEVGNRERETLNMEEGFTNVLCFLRSPDRTAI
jgi:hypothetical protein